MIGRRDRFDVAMEMLSGVVIILMVCGFVWAGCETGRESGSAQVRDEAVKHGVAEYYIDDKYQKQFRWKK